MTGDFLEEEKNAIHSALNSAYDKLDSIIINWGYRHDAPFPLNIHNLNNFIDLFAKKNQTGFLFTLNQDLFFERRPPNAYYGIPGFEDSRGRFRDHPRLPVKKVVAPPQIELDNKKEEIMASRNAFFIKLHGSHDWLSSDGSDLMVIGGIKKEHIRREPILSWYLHIPPYSPHWRKESQGAVCRFSAGLFQKTLYPVLPGLYDKTFAGLENLHNAYKNDLNKLSFSMVYASPYSEMKLESIAKFITSINWLPDNFFINFTYPHVESAPCDFHNNRKELNRFDFSLTSWAKKRFLIDYKNKRKSHLLANVIEEDKLARLLQRPLMTHDSIRKVSLNGCCIPGARRAFIMATGNIKICERIGKAPYIGNVNDGINYEAIKKYYIDEYSEKSLKNCSSCWFLRLCSICYQHAFKNFKVDMEKKNMHCYMHILMGIENLKYFCTLMEINNKGLDYLYEWEII